MNRLIKTLLYVVLLFSLLMSTACKPWTIVKNEEKQDDGSIQIYFASDDFDATAFANDIWDNQLTEYYDQRKVNLIQLIDGLKNDPDTTGASYAIGSNDIGSKWQFVVEGKAKVLEVNTESRAGIMSIDLEPYDGVADAIIQIGPVVKGTTIRDTLDFIKLDDFQNQVEFASISKAFNQLIVDKVIGTKDLGEYVGKEIELLGCFAYEDITSILISPISITGLESE